MLGAIVPTGRSLWSTNLDHEQLCAKKCPEGEEEAEGGGEDPQWLCCFPCKVDGEGDWIQHLVSSLERLPERPSQLQQMSLLPECETTFVLIVFILI